MGRASPCCRGGREVYRLQPAPCPAASRAAGGASPPAGRLRYHWQSFFERTTADMIELNPVRQRITDLTDRVLSLRGYL
jgi:hypothetical protein